LVFLYFFNRLRQTKGQGDDDADSQPILVEEFPEYIAMKRQNDFAALKQEYKVMNNVYYLFTLESRIKRHKTKL
jgi:hypothetical protein